MNSDACAQPFLQNRWKRSERSHNFDNKSFHLIAQNNPSVNAQNEKILWNLFDFSQQPFSLGTFDLQWSHFQFLCVQLLHKCGEELVHANAARYFAISFIQDRQNSNAIATVSLSVTKACKICLVAQHVAKNALAFSCFNCIFT